MDTEEKLRNFESFNQADKVNILLTAADVIEKMRSHVFDCELRILQVLESNATLEARCKELESALNNFDDLAMVTDKTYAIYHAKLKAKTKNLLATPTTTKHLANWYQGMLGEPVAFNHHFIQDYDFMPEEVLSHIETVPAISGLKYANKTEPLYAPKKVSE